LSEEGKTGNWRGEKKRGDDLNGEKK